MYTVGYKELLPCFLPHFSPTAISCGDPGVPPFTILTGRKFTNGAVVSYSCSQGRALVGNVTLHCQEDGRWSGSPPYCSGMKSSSSEPSAKSVPDSLYNYTTSNNVLLTPKSVYSGLMMYDSGGTGALKAVIMFN